MIIVSMRRPWCSRKVGGAAARLVPAAKCNELLSILDGERKRLVPDGLNATVLLNARLARHSADLHRAVWAPAHRSFESGTSLTCLRRMEGGGGARTSSQSTPYPRGSWPHLQTQQAVQIPWLLRQSQIQCSRSSLPPQIDGVSAADGAIGQLPTNLQCNLQKLIDIVDSFIIDIEYLYYDTKTLKNSIANSGYSVQKNLFFHRQKHVDSL